MTTNRIRNFLDAAGWAGATAEALAGDASSRRFTRLRMDGESRVLMDAPLPEHRTAAFVDIAGRLTELGLSAPKIHAADNVAGLLLIEDFGDAIFARLLDRGEAAAPLLQLAVDTLIALHGAGGGAAAEGLPVFDAAMFAEQAALFTTAYLPFAGLEAAPADDFQALWAAPLAEALAVPSTLMLRDYFAGNLVHLADRTGVAACGLLDFQDAGIGPVTYDLVSLLDDARRDISDADAADCGARHRRAFPGLPADLYDLSCDVLAAQRHVRVLAVFARLATHSRPGYAAHMPRIWRLLERRLGHPTLAEVARWMANYCPPERRLPDNLF
jgi:aminoglycoside/choline kinase family phosphotransferase